MYKKGNYELFSQYIDEIEWEVEFSNKSINECYDIFLYQYRYATEEFIPKLVNPKNKSKKSWMTPELKNKIKYKNNMWLINKSLKWTNEVKSREYKRLKIEVRKCIKDNVKNFEQNIAGKFKSNPKLLYKYINEKRSVRTHIRAMEDENGDMVVDNHGIANILNNYFHSVYTVDNHTQSHIVEDLTESKLLTIELNRYDVESRLSNLDPNKAMGVDLVHPLVLKKCSRSLSKPLHIIFKKSIDLGVLPDTWKEANVTPLFKKGSKLKPSNYRPVSLTSIPCKILERIIAENIMKYLLVNKLLSEEQHGFMKGKSCTTNL